MITPGSCSQYDSYDPNEELAKKIIQTSGFSGEDLSVLSLSRRKLKTAAIFSDTARVQLKSRKKVEKVIGHFVQSAYEGRPGLKGSLNTKAVCRRIGEVVTDQNFTPKEFVRAPDISAEEFVKNALEIQDLALRLNYVQSGDVSQLSAFTALGPQKTGIKVPYTGTELAFMEYYSTTLSGARAEIRLILESERGDQAAADKRIFAVISANSKKTN